MQACCRALPLAGKAEVQDEALAVAVGVVVDARAAEGLVDRPPNDAA